MRNSKLLGGILVILGSLVVIIGSNLAWAKAGGIIQVSKSGTRGDGVITLLAGIVILVMGILTLILNNYGFATVFIILGGLGCIGVAVIDWIDAANRFAGLSNEYISVSVGEGIYIVLVGGVLAIVGAIISRIGASKRSAVAPPVPSQQYSCPHCGKAVNYGDRFCTGCGTGF